MSDAIFKGDKNMNKKINVLLRLIKQFDNEYLNTQNIIKDGSVDLQTRKQLLITIYNYCMKEYDHVDSLRKYNINMLKVLFNESTNSETKNLIPFYFRNIVLYFDVEEMLLCIFYPDKYLYGSTYDGNPILSEIVMIKNHLDFISTLKNYTLRKYYHIDENNKLKCIKQDQLISASNKNSLSMEKEDLVELWKNYNDTLFKCVLENKRPKYLDNKKLWLDLHKDLSSIHLCLLEGATYDSKNDTWGNKQIEVHINIMKIARELLEGLKG